MSFSWAENQQGALLYPESFLRSALEQPGTSLDLCPAGYEDGKLVAFGAAFPRRIQADGQTWNLLLDSFITVAPSHKGRGLGAAIWRGLAEIGKRHGFDGLITMCVEGDHMNTLLPGIAERSALPTVHALTIQYLGRPVPKDREGSLRKANSEFLMRGSWAINENVEFGRVWTQQEAEWQCREREGAFGCSLAGSAGGGTISAYTQLAAGATPTLCGLVDDIIWGELEAAERKQLAGTLLESAATAGVDLLLAPVLNYTDMTALSEVGFRKTRRALNMYLTSWNPHFKLHALSGAYIDVF
jgi:GNAT superfamily N-acetyltransferase